MSAHELLDKAESILKGEPARIIGYGAAVVIYLVAKVSGSIEDQSPEQALVSGTAAIATIITIIESIRRLVYSPASVAAIVTSPPTAAGPIDAAVAAGVDADTINAAADGNV